MSDLLFKTRGMVNPKGKPRVFFTCSPYDFEKTFDKVCDDILNEFDCAIYYSENMSREFTQEEQTVTLGMMNLFVIPVTRNLLSQPNRAMDSDLAFAVRNGIPVLPIMFETGLDGIYSRKDKFGELQYINPFSSDITEIGYEEKLKKFLGSVLISNKTSERIKKAFGGYIFLSYRKIDRHYANELIKIIHSYREFSNIAIWYDEYLVPGESFHENIIEMINRSKVFTLLVTPNVLLDDDKGIPNFVVRVECPKAKELGMEIVTVEMKSTSKKELSEKLGKLPDCVNPREGDGFKSILMQSLKKAGVAFDRNDPERDYLIGLAYRDGFDVEVDRKKGTEFIKKAAESGFAEAADELVTMYYYGFCVAKDYRQAAYWQKKKIQCLRKENETLQTTESIFELIDSLRFYTEIVRNSVDKQENIYELIEYCKEALCLCDGISLTDEYAGSRFVESKLNTLRALALSYEDAGDFDNAYDVYKKALRLWQKVAEADKAVDEDLRTNVTNKWRIAQLHHDIGILFEKKGEVDKAIAKFEDSLEIYNELALETTDFIPEMIGIHAALAQEAVYADMSKSMHHSKLSVKLSKVLYDKEPEKYDVLYAKTLLARVFVLSQAGASDIEELEEVTGKALEIFSAHKNDGSKESIINLMNTLYRMAGVYRRRFDGSKAIEYYLRAIQTADDLLSIADIDDIEVIAHLLFDYGTGVIAFLGVEELEIAEDALKKALRMFKEVSLIKVQCNKYVEEAESVLRAIIVARNSVYSEEQTSCSEKEEEISEALDKFDFALSPFTDENADCSMDLLQDGESDLSLLFDTLFGSYDNTPEEEVYPYTITLSDENGVEIEFQVADVIDYQENEYFILVAGGDIKEGVLIMMSDGPENCVSVEDKTLYSVLFEMFKEQNKGRFGITE